MNNKVNTLAELLEQKAALEKQIKQQQSKQRKRILTDIVASMQKHNISLADIENQLSAPTSIAPKYCNPKTGATWSGRGKRPKWIVDAENQGVSLDTFLIK